MGGVVLRGAFQLGFQSGDFCLEGFELSRFPLRQLVLRPLLLSDGSVALFLGVLSAKLGVVCLRGDDPLSGEQFLEDVLVFLEDQLDEAVGAGGGVKHGAVVPFASD